MTNSVAHGVVCRPGTRAGEAAEGTAQACQEVAGKVEGGAG